MRRIILVFAFVLLPFFLMAQSKTFTINWNAAVERTNIKNTGAKAASSVDDRLSLQISEDALNYQTQWKDTGFADEGSLQVSNIVYGSLTSEELSKLNKELVPENVSYTIRSTKARDILYTIFSISPVVKTNGSFKKVVSFAVNYRYAAQKQQGLPPSISNSVLSSGKWYKFKVEKTGIYKLDKSFLNSLGMNTSGINPRNLKVYGNGGKPLPLYNKLNFIFDLPETSIQVVGEEDNSFDNGDFILFYGTSTKGYDPENRTNLNPYSDDSYYYVTADGPAGKRVGNMVEPSGAASTTISQFDDYKFQEEDQFSPTLVGREWFGNRFDVQSEQSYSFDFPNIVASEPVKVEIVAASASESATSLAITINSTSLNPISFPRVGSGALLQIRNFNADVPNNGESVKVDLAYNNSGNPSSVAYLNYINIEAVRQLTGAGGQLAFRYKKAETLSGIADYQISNASQFSQVWDVTNPQFITTKNNEGNATTLSYKANLGEIRQYVAINPTDYFVPTKIAKSVVQNQNLKGTIFQDENGEFKDVDYIIITAPFLIQPALRLANYHKNLNGLNVKVVTTDKIYEEFSSGKQDISAIRNFLRYVYFNASSDANRLKYVCMFGDTSVDYKNRLSGNNNIVPSFHTLPVTSSVSSFISDDFFGNMDENEGTIGGYTIDENGNRITSDTDRLDIAMGRILADNVSLANSMVDKIINYTSESSHGNWRTNFLLVSDDVDVLLESILEQNLDDLGETISAEKPFINVKKIHSDAFQQEASAGGDRYPKVNEEIKKEMEVGAIIMNYFGHGGEDGLAKEFIYTKDLAIDLKNKNNLPCVITVTCEFTKFDNPLRITAGELTYQNKEGGAIALVTTTRSITIYLGVDFNEKLASELFGFGKEVPDPPAEGLRKAKNDINDPLRRVVFFIGDPAMQLAFPKKDIRITKLNDVPIAQATDTLKALSKVKISGEVINASGNVMTDYTGILEAKVLDKNVQRQTLDNDGEGYVMNFSTLGEKLFNGKASITNGQFEFEFVVPRDIQIPVGKGRVSLYAKRENVVEDQAGVDLTLNVGGLNENAPEDNEGPLIRLFMNDESFVTGGITDDSPILIAQLEDPNGINTASGIGHDIVAVLDGDESNPFLLNEFYQAEVDDYTKGKTNFKFRDLEDGLHTLTLKAWDVYNNSSTAEIQFIVAGDDKLKITRVLNYPNPFVNYTEFWFNHNRPFEDLEVQVQVFTVTGKIVWTKNDIVRTDGFLSRNIVWDGRDDFGDRIGKGVYVYKITVKSTLTNQRVEKYEKLVIL